MVSEEHLQTACRWGLAPQLGSGLMAALTPGMPSTPHPRYPSPAVLLEA